MKIWRRKIVGFSFCCPFSALRFNHGIRVSEKINANKQVRKKEPLLTFEKDGEVLGKLRSFYFSISLWRFYDLDSESVYLFYFRVFFNPDTHLNCSIIYRVRKKDVILCEYAFREWKMVYFYEPVFSLWYDNDNRQFSIICRKIVSELKAMRIFLCGCTAISPTMTEYDDDVFDVSIWLSYMYDTYIIYSDDTLYLLIYVVYSNVGLLSKKKIAKIVYFAREEIPQIWLMIHLLLSSFFSEDSHLLFDITTQFFFIEYFSMLTACSIVTMYFIWIYFSYSFILKRK